MKKIAYVLTIAMFTVIGFGCGNTATEKKEVTKKDTIVKDTVKPIDTIKKVDTIKVVKKETVKK